MATISSPGIGSGLDVNSIVTQLMAIERAPITLLDRKEASFQAKISSYGTIKSSLAELQTAAKALATPATFSPITASVADASKLSVAASATAVAGSYDVEVISLAQSQKMLMSKADGGGYSTMNSTVGTGTITINFGTYSAAEPPTFTANPDKLTAKTSPVSITIGSDNQSLSGVRDAINAANAGVSASIINDGNGFRLSLTSLDTGARNAMQISVAAPASDSGTSIGELGQLAYDPASAKAATYNADGSVKSAAVADTSKMMQNVAPQDAVIKVDNILVTKQSNTISDAIQGVTLTLGQTMAAGTTTKVTLTRDTSNVKTSIEAFVKAYNDANTAMRSATAFDPLTSTAAVLTGDSTMRSIQNQLHTMFSAPVAGAPSGTAMLSDAGISFQKDGSLAIDGTKLAAATADPTKDLSKLFATSDTGNGYGYQMDVLIGRILSPVGIMASRTNSFGTSIQNIGDQRTTVEDRLVNIEKRYRAQYTALDTLIAKMTSTSSFLTQQLASLSANA
jgi:flagellar hook-associated protein 2